MVIVVEGEDGLALLDGGLANVLGLADESGGGGLLHQDLFDDDGFQGFVRLAVAKAKRPIYTCR